MSLSALPKHYLKSLQLQGLHNSAACLRGHHDEAECEEETVAGAQDETVPPLHSNDSVLKNKNFDVILFKHICST